MITEEMQIKYIVIGIGINVNSKSVLSQAVSLKDILIKKSDRNEIISDIIKNFNELFLKYEKGEYQAIFNFWKENLGWIGRQVSFNTGRGIITGILKDIDKDGAVIIQSDNKEQVFYSGDLIV
jgi:BirA family biotin operon repressor/biotin-[acetyl-CoA-carboxylase] ligase